MIFEFGRYILDVDVEKTKAFYQSQFSTKTNERCSCPRCQRFSKEILTSSNVVLDFLHSLGVDPQKAGEIIDGPFDETTNCDYYGWYHIVGTMLNRKSTPKQENDDNCFLPDINSIFRVWFNDDREKMGPIEDGFPSPVLEMSFSVVLPLSKSE